jgi:hypothetical protein
MISFGGCVKTFYLDNSTFFISLEGLKPYRDEAKLLKKATFSQFVDAYCNFAHLYVSKMDSHEEALYILSMTFTKPYSFFYRAGKDEAYAFIRSEIIRDKLFSKLNDKQRLFLDTNYSLFIDSLNKKQARLLREFNELAKYLK